MSPESKSKPKVRVNERQWKNQMADFGNVQNLPFAFFSTAAIYILLISCTLSIEGHGLSAAWVMREDGLLPSGGVNVGVNFCGCDALVAKHVLDYTEVCTVFDKMGRKGVTEGVR